MVLDENIYLGFSIFKAGVQGDTHPHVSNFIIQLWYWINDRKKGKAVGKNVIFD